MKQDITVTLTTETRRKWVAPLFIHFDITARYSNVSIVHHTFMHGINTYLQYRYSVNSTVFP